MIKARALAGDQVDIDYLESMLRPFIFRRYLDFSAFESIREMKAMIDRAAKPFDPKGFWKKKTVRNMTKSQNNALARIFAIREKIAERKNLPRDFIIRKEKIFLMVEQRSLENIILPRPMRGKEIQKILATI
jgi:hypothetical protein